MQVVSGPLVRSGMWPDRRAWARFTGMTLGIVTRRRYQQRLPLPDQRSAIASASADEWARRRAEQEPTGAQAGDMRRERIRHTLTHEPAPAAFDDFYARHEQPLYGYLRRLLPSHEIAVELAQESFFRAWRHFDQLGSYDRPEAWLYRVATNLAISHLRRRYALSFSSLFAPARPRAAEAESDEPAGADLFAAPLDLEGQTAERDMIERVLRALPERQRAALLLAAMQGFSSDEIAAALGVSPGNARQLLSRARERFRRLYDEGQRPTR